ncbi:hypothetical protein [Maricaulis sp.]|uniref:hypothetical protein n=1 Tax=Maricaulis sp. TaxID=1486257 RepID=UPI002B26C095|nr:hypothetical protein [Maricaulis sp.]
MGEGAPKDYSKGAILERLRQARQGRDGEIIWLGWVLDTAAIFVLIAFGWTLGSMLVFVGARFVARVPTLVGWGYLAALVGFIVVPMLFLFFNTP